MAGLLLYSTNPWYAHEISVRYRNGQHFVWCSEHYDPSTLGAATAAALVAPSSCPKAIYDQLKADCEREDTHSALIAGYRKTFKRLANTWRADGSITREQADEIVSTVKSASWRIWRPVLYLIPKAGVTTGARLKSVPYGRRAAYGPEWQIHDLQIHEFDLIER